MTHAQPNDVHARQAPTIVLVEDDPAVANALTEVLTLAGYACESFANGAAAIARVERGGVALVVSDINLPGIDGFGVLSAFCGRPGQPPVILMTAYGTIDRAVRAMQIGAVDFLTKPFRPHELLTRVARWLGEHDADDPIAVDPRTRAVFEQARRIAPSDANVLLTGESGTGKEVLARFLHRHSRRARGPFVGVNCAAIPDNLLESTLFGHERYAFTGANKDQKGKFALAQGGTLLLDEVTEMPLALQAKLLRVLQEREVEPLGSGAPVPVDVRVIATSNRSMQQAVADRVLREDLYFRLCVLPLELPPLRERRADIVPLARALLARHAQKLGRTVIFAPAAEARLYDHAWPGNVRELDNVVQRTLLLSNGSCLHEIDFGPTLATSTRFDVPVQHLRAEPREDTTSGELGDTRRVAERERILAALERHNGRRGDAARELGIAERTLRHRLQKLREDGELDRV